MEKQQTPAEMFRERQNTIKEYRSETQLSIALGQALNLAVSVLKDDIVWRELPDEGKESLLNHYVNFFMSYLDKKRKEVFDANERMYAQNPAPTVEQYEQMSEVQQKFLKDKQLEANRKAYAERRNVTPAESLAARVAQKQKMLQTDFQKLNEDRLNNK